MQNSQSNLHFHFFNLSAKYFGNLAHTVHLSLSNSEQLGEANENGANDSGVNGNGSNFNGGATHVAGGGRGLATMTLGAGGAKITGVGTAGLHNT